MATVAAMAMLKPAKNLVVASSNPGAPRNFPMKPCLSLLALQRLPKGLALSGGQSPSAAAAAAMAGAFFSALSASDAAFAAQQMADLAAAAPADDKRGLALLLPIVPAVLWVLYNILQPALNQLNRMRSEKALVVGLGLGAGLAAGGLASAPGAAASEEVAAVAAAAAENDNRGLLLLFVVAPAIVWVLYNILQPALNQLNRMRSE